MGHLTSLATCQFVFLMCVFVSSYWRINFFFFFCRLHSLYSAHSPTAAGDAKPSTRYCVYPSLPLSLSHSVWSKLINILLFFSHTTRSYVNVARCKDATGRRSETFTEGGRLQSEPRRLERPWQQRRRHASISTTWQAYSRGHQ